MGLIRPLIRCWLVRKIDTNPFQQKHTLLQFVFMYEEHGRMKLQSIKLLFVTKPWSEKWPCTANLFSEFFKIIVN